MAIFDSSNNPMRNYPEGDGYNFPCFTDVITAIGVILVVFCALVFWRPSRKAA